MFLFWVFSVEQKKSKPVKQTWQSKWTTFQVVRAISIDNKGKKRDTKQRVDYGYTIDMSKQNKRNPMHIHDDGDLNRCTGDQARVWSEHLKKKH